MLTLFSLRGQIGVVPQAPILFDDTIMNNVRYAKLTATDEEVYEACKAASIHDQILTFTDGMFLEPVGKTTEPS
jgi:ABC-type multidrug transport system fused ATPase/permease subunit